MTDQTISYDVSRFDEGYYNRGERGGFREYIYDSKAQKEQLALKWELCQDVPHDSALFIGCARGYEVAYWREHKKEAWGLDVSRWAIDNALDQVKPYCSLFDGKNIAPDMSTDLVCAFDVLTLLPEDMAFLLVQNMIRVALKGIVIRTIVKNWRNISNPVDGMDGVSYKYRRLHDWDWLFTRSGKFALDTAKTHHNYETTFVWKRTA